MRKNSTIIGLYVAFILLGQVHRVFRCTELKEYDVFLLIDYKLDQEWIARHVESKLQTICLALVGFHALPGIRKQLKLFAIIIVLFTVFDLLMYFVNFNKDPFYTLAYWIIAAFLFKIFK